MTEITISQQLQEPFAVEDLEWRVQNSGVSNNNKPWAMVVAYVTNRAIQQRLDDVLGFGGWQNEYKPSPDGKGFLCGLSIKHVDEWITKWDGAENTNIEPLKGGLSNSMKRAAVQFGVGRYLYNLEAKFAVCNIVDSRRDSENNYAYDKKTNSHIDWASPDLPEWALPHIKSDSFIENMKNCEDLASLKYAFNDAWRHTKAFGRLDLQPKFKSEYDAMVIKIDDIAKTNIEKALKAAQEGMSKQLNTLHLIPDASAVQVICETLKKDMTKAHEGQYYDLKPLIQEINKQQAARIETINNPEVKQNEQ